MRSPASISLGTSSPLRTCAVGTEPDLSWSKRIRLWSRVAVFGLAGLPEKDTTGTCRVATVNSLRRA